ncbi:MAG: phage holin family protein [Pseudomonadota bacterium]
MSSARAGGEPPLSPVRAAARTLVVFAETRLRIAASEIEEQALRLAEIALWLLAATFFLGVALVFASVLVVLAVPEDRRLLAGALVVLAYLLAGAGAAFVLRRRLAERPPLFSATLAELEKDRKRFSGGQGAEERA